MRKTAPRLILALSCLLALCGCEKSSFRLLKVEASPVFLSGEGTSSSYLSLFLTFEGDDGKEVDVTLKSPSGNFWSFKTVAVKIDGVTYRGSSRLSFPLRESGTYHLSAMRSDGATAESDVEISPGGNVPSLSVSLRDGKAVWEGGEELSWTAYDKRGNVVEEGKSTSPLALRREWGKVVFSREKDGWLSLYVLPIA